MLKDRAKPKQDGVLLFNPLLLWQDSISTAQLQPLFLWKTKEVQEVMEVIGKEWP